MDDDEKYTAQDVANIVDSEGLGYALESYLSWTSIEDARLREAWKKAADALQEVRNLLPEPDEG